MAILGLKISTRIARTDQSEPPDFLGPFRGENRRFGFLTFRSILPIREIRAFFSLFGNEIRSRIWGQQSEHPKSWSLKVTFCKIPFGALRKGPPFHGSRSSREIKIHSASCQMGGREVTRRDKTASFCREMIGREVTGR